MAISKEEVLHRCEVFPPTNPDAALSTNDGTTLSTNDGNPTIRVNMVITFDDDSDPELPVVSNHITRLQRFDEEGNPTDVSGQPQIVQDICAAVWV